MGLLGKEGGRFSVPQDKVALLGCDCGWPDCWPLAARITIDDTTVRWGDFEQPFRDWDYSGFGPFEVDVEDYRLELEKLRS